MSKDCVFCRIAAGELPSCKVYEDEEILAFMDIGPVTKGHALVVPKRHYNPLTETPLQVLEKIIAVVQKIARAQVEGLAADGVNVTQANGETAGQVVPHIHFHVIPRYLKDDHSWNFPQKKYDSRDEMEKFAASIRKNLKDG